MSNINKLTEITGQRFRSFGGGQGSNWNPVVNALKDNPLQFAAGVDIKDVIVFVLEQSGYDALLNASRNVLGHIDCSHCKIELKAAIKLAEKGA